MQRLCLLVDVSLSLLTISFYSIGEIWKSSCVWQDQLDLSIYPSLRYSPDGLCVCVCVSWHEFSSGIQVDYICQRRSCYMSEKFCGTNVLQTSINARLCWTNSASIYLVPKRICLKSGPSRCAIYWFNQFGANKLISTATVLNHPKLTLVINPNFVT